MNAFAAFGILVALFLSIGLTGFGIGYLIEQLKDFYSRFKYSHEEIGYRNAGKKILQESYWFSEDKNVQEALKCVGSYMLNNGQNFNIEICRKQWRSWCINNSTESIKNE